MAHASLRPWAGVSVTLRLCMNKATLLSVFAVILSAWRSCFLSPLLVCDCHQFGFSHREAPPSPRASDLLSSPSLHHCRWPCESVGCQRLGHGPAPSSSPPPCSAGEINRFCHEERDDRTVRAAEVKLNLPDGQKSV